VRSRTRVRSHSSQNSPMIRLLVGLGNPGPEYEATRHNAGFWFVDAVARELNAQWVPDRSYYGLVARVSRRDGPVWLLKPMTFMNLSGKSWPPWRVSSRSRPATCWSPTTNSICCPARSR